MIERLLSVGNVIIDITAHLDHLPVRGGDVLADESSIGPGGSSNLLVAARRQGLPAGYAGAHGTGPFGELVRAALAEQDVDVLLEPTAGADTGYCVAITDSGGERTFVTAFGAEATLEAAQLARLTPRSGDAVHVSGYGLLARTNGAVLTPWLGALDPEVVLVFDPGPLLTAIDAERLQTVLRRADWISCNEDEAGLLTGESKPVDAVAALARHQSGVLLRLGAQGCLVQPAGEAADWLEGFPVVAVDSNGAGDAHTGAFLAALARGATAAEAAYRANACAALAVSRRGPATAPSEEEVDAFLDIAGGAAAPSGSEARTEY